MFILFFFDIFIYIYIFYLCTYFLCIYFIYVYIILFMYIFLYCVSGFYGENIIILYSVGSSQIKKKTVIKTD